MIIKHSFRGLRNAEELQRGVDIVSLINTANPVALGIAKQANAFAECVSNIEGAFKVEQANALSRELSALDEDRDALIMGISAISKGYLYHFTPAVVAQAEALVASLALYGPDLVRLNFQAETASINSLLNDWTTKPNLVAALDTLHLTEWKTELAAVNASFAAKYTERAAMDGQAATQLTVKELRVTATQCWDKMITAINGLYAVNEDDAVKGPALQTLINSINGISDKYVQLLTNRQARVKKPGEPPAGE